MNIRQFTRQQRRQLRRSFEKQSGIGEMLSGMLSGSKGKPKVPGTSGGPGRPPAGGQPRGGQRADGTPSFSSGYMADMLNRPGQTTGGPTTMPYQPGNTTVSPTTMDLPPEWSTSRPGSTPPIVPSTGSTGAPSSDLLPGGDHLGAGRLQGGAASGQAPQPPSSGGAAGGSFFDRIQSGLGQLGGMLGIGGGDGTPPSPATTGPPAVENLPAPVPADPSAEGAMENLPAPVPGPAEPTAEQPADEAAPPEQPTTQPQDQAQQDVAPYDLSQEGAMAAVFDTPGQAPDWNRVSQTQLTPEQRTELQTSFQSDLDAFAGMDGAHRSSPEGKALAQKALNKKLALKHAGKPGSTPAADAARLAKGGISIDELRGNLEGDAGAQQQIQQSAQEQGIDTQQPGGMMEAMGAWWSSLDPITQLMLGIGLGTAVTGAVTSAFGGGKAGGIMGILGMLGIGGGLLHMLMKSMGGGGGGAEGGGAEGGGAEGGGAEATTPSASTGDQSGGPSDPMFAEGAEVVIDGRTHIVRDGQYVPKPEEGGGPAPANPPSPRPTAGASTRSRPAAGQPTQQLGPQVQ